MPFFVCQLFSVLYSIEFCQSVRLFVCPSKLSVLYCGRKLGRIFSLVAYLCWCDMLMYTEHRKYISNFTTDLTSVQFCMCCEMHHREIISYCCIRAQKQEDTNTFGLQRTYSSLYNCDVKKGTSVAPAAPVASKCPKPHVDISPFPEP